MKISLSAAHQFSISAIPAFATVVIAALPTQAATFALAQADVEIFNFNQTPLVTNAITNTQATSVFSSADAAIATTADAQAAFIAQPVNPVNVAFNFAVAQSQGVGNAYWGQGNSLAAVIGNFSIPTNNTFSFSFATRLRLKTSIDSPTVETADAVGSIVFRLLDSNTGNILDTFGLKGQSMSQRVPAFQALSNNVSLDISPTLDSDNIFFAELNGVYSRRFDAGINLTLEEVKTVSVHAQAIPEPATVGGTVLAVLALVRKARSRAKCKRATSGF